MRNKLTVGVFAIILDNENKVLLGHRTDYDFWNLPGGGMEKNETPWEGVKREVKEETGLDVEVTKLVGIYSKPDENDLILSFRAKVVGGELTLSNEADKLEYFPVDKLPPNTSPKHAERIKDAMKNLPEPVLSEQHGKSARELFKKGKI